jgi:hypothetical protein
MQASVLELALYDPRPVIGEFVVQWPAARVVSEAE